MAETELGLGDGGTLSSMSDSFSRRNASRSASSRSSSLVCAVELVRRSMPSILGNNSASEKSQKRRSQEKEKSICAKSECNYGVQYTCTRMSRS